MIFTDKFRYLINLKCSQLGDGLPFFKISAHVRFNPYLKLAKSKMSTLNTSDLTPGPSLTHHETNQNQGNALVEILSDQSVSQQEFEDIKVNPEKRNILIKSLAASVVPNQIRKIKEITGNRADPDLAFNDCLIAINRLISTYDPSFGHSLEKYISYNLL